MRTAPSGAGPGGATPPAVAADPSAPHDRVPHAPDAGARPEPASRRQRAVMTAAIVLSVLLSVAYAATRSPWWDEGLYADVANQFAASGQLSSSVMAPTGTFGFAPLPGMDRRAYWTTPLYPVTMGLWFRTVGVGMVQMRLVSVACTLLLLAGWWAVVRALTRSHGVAAIAVSLIALDSHVLWSASIGRPEAMAAALGALGMAAYLRLRDTRYDRAVAAAAALFALAALAHPMVAVTGAAFTVLVLALDWRRLRVRHVAIVALTGAAVFAPWIAYILADVELFRAQWGANAGSRDGGLKSPVRALLTDFSGRYLNLHFTSLHGVSRARIVELLALVATAAIAVASPAVRRAPGAGRVAILAGVSWAALAILDGTRWVQYFAHVYPAYLALAAVVLLVLWRQGGWRRAAALALGVALVAPGVGGLLHRILQNPYRNDYLPAVAATRRYQEAGATVVGGSELAFALGFDGSFVDDMELQRPADVYVQGEQYLTDKPGAWQRRVRARLRADFTPVFENGRFKVFVRRELARGGRAGGGG